ncbi:helix-turn-helix transcriptional regulator [Streptomyces sp. NPDC086554]|uniref:helix-turn-helix domain-containing protein n=1 Tax=Streptomyces sp. NPDC086554 TaxID=3154864 RepID=UPI00342792B5
MPPARKLDPTASVAHLLGYKVQKAREALGWTQTELADKVPTTQNRISQIENATDPPSLKMTTQLDAMLGLKGALVELWPLVGISGFQDYAQPFLKQQGTARTIHEFSLTVPGLLQTEDYANAIMSLSVPDGSEDLADKITRRMERQSVFERDEPPWHWVLLDENALNRAQGSKETMAAQIERLLTDVQRPYINVQILPANAACTPGSFSLLTMPDGERCAYTEGFRTGMYFEEPAEVDRYQRIYDRLRSDALGTDESERLMRNALEKHR